MYTSFTNKIWHFQSSNVYTSALQILELLQTRRALQVHTEVAIPLPTIFKDIEKAVARIKSAITNKEIVYIFGDYDCDGITGTAQLARYFQRQGISPIVKLPHRMHDGYGIQMHSAEAIIQSKASLVITVDTGITAVAEIALLKASGIDTIITDHHMPPEVAPDAYAIIHPAYITVSELFAPSGSAVVHFLIRALEEDKNWHDRMYDESLMMLGLIADLVPLTGINRSLAIRGLDSFSQLQDTPIHALLLAMNKNGTAINSTTVAFQIAPPINAAGRIADPLIALKGLLGDKEMIDLMAKLNVYRKEVTFKHAGAILEQCTLPEWQEKGLVSWLDDSISHGIIGLISGKLTEKTGKPSIVATVENNICTASLRSPSSYNIMQGLAACSHLLLRYGGHAQAAGCSFASEHWSEICTTINNNITQTIAVSDLLPTITIDAIIDTSVLTLEAIDILTALEPFGHLNPEPLFVLKNIIVTDPRIIGANQEHLQCKVQNIAAIGFNFGECALQLQEPVDIACTLQKREWNGQTSVQIFIVDIRPATN